MKFGFQLGQTKIITYCSNDYKEQVESLFDKFRELDKKGPPLKNGATIAFGWSTLLLKGDDKELVIYEPDFYKNPFYDYLPQVENTLKILTSQISLLNYLKIEGISANYSDNIVISKGCLEADRIYLERSDIERKNDSGWYIGEIDKENIDDSLNNYDCIYVFQLLQIRPALMQILALPLGYLAVFQKDEIIQIFNSEGENIWI